MFRRALALAAGVALFLGVLACSSPEKESSSGDGDGHQGLSEPKTYTSLDPSEVCPAFIEDACRAVFACPELAEVTEYEDEAHCRQDVPCRGLNNFEVEIEMGYLVWDQTKAAQCHSFLNADLCGAADALATESLQGVLSLCPDLPAIPQQQEGEVCLSSLDCVSGTYCVTADSCGGICVPAGGAGALCDYDRDCADGLPCLRGSCGKPPVVGEPCEGLRCEAGSECELVGLDFVCVAQTTLGQGEDCNVDSDCVGDLNCRRLGDTATCEPLQSTGGACEGTWDCVQGLACIQGVCGTEPTLGQTCDSFLFGGHDCAAGLICEEDVCKERRFWGDSCGGELETCAEGLCEGGECVPRRRLGAACEMGNDCRFRRCEDGKCIDPASCP